MAGAVQVAGFCLDMATSVLDVKVASNRNKQSEKLLQWSDFFNFNNSNRVYCKWKYINKFPIYHVSACIYLGSWLLQTNILSGIINSPSVTTSRWYLSCCHIAVGFPEKSPPFAGTWAMSVFHRKKNRSFSHFILRFSRCHSKLFRLRTCSGREYVSKNVWPKRQWRVEVAEKGQI